MTALVCGSVLLIQQLPGLLILLAEILTFLRFDVFSVVNTSGI